jgi:superfamily II DNA or RNA helicase
MGPILRRESPLRLRLPPQFAIDLKTTHGHSIQQLEVAAFVVEGNLARYETRGLRGWLFQPAVGEEILLVPHKTKIIPETFHNIVSFDLEETANFVNASTGIWLKTSISTIRGNVADLSEPIGKVLASWTNAFSYRQEDRKLHREGLRKPQIGALHALSAHWTVSDSTATVVMPTGTGKTEAMLSILVSQECRKVMVVVPTDALRSQLYLKFLSLGILKTPGVGVVSSDASYPIVCNLQNIPTSVEEVDSLMAKTQVCISTSAILGRSSQVVQERFAKHCSYLFIDEAHHVEAPTWTGFKRCFANTRIVQFTATPFREDGKQLEGKIVFRYPLHKAQEEEYFRPIKFETVNIYDKADADKAIAEKAIACLRANWDSGQVLMARVSTVKRAKHIFPLYSGHADLNAIEMHTGLTIKAREAATKKLLSGEARVVVCVDMLGEGFDMPELKIAAFHDIRKSLAITLQLAGRFTRVKEGLGDATFIANVADVDVQQELKKLYTQDPDWNKLLPELSEQLIGLEIASQEFIADFDYFPADVPLQAVKPATSAVIYKTRCKEWNPENFRAGILQLEDCLQVHHTVNANANVLIIVITRRLPLPWTDAQNLHSVEWELYVAYWNKSANLLFINNSGNNGEFGQLARAIAGEDASLITGDPLFRAFAGLSLVKFQNVGLTEMLGRNIRYTGRMGGDVEPSITQLQRGTAQKAVLAGTGYTKGELETIGVSKKGRIWSHRRERLDRFPAWCDEVGQKVTDASIDPDEIFKHCLLSKIVDQRPDKMPIAIDWPADIYLEAERRWEFVLDEEEVSISITSIELVLPSLGTPLRFRVYTESLSKEFELDFIVDGETKDFAFRLRGEGKAAIKHGANAREVALTDFFYRNPPVIWFADGSSLSGNEFTELRIPQPLFARDEIEAWDWTGTNIKRESQGTEKDAETVQWKVIDELKRDEQVDLVFDDDSPGEAADVIAIKVIGGLKTPERVEIELLHCKFSGAETAGARVKDLYEVCGQAQTSIWWAAAILKKQDLLAHMLKREEQRKRKYGTSRIEKGSVEVIRTIQNIATLVPISLSIAIVQPGLSKSAVSEDQLRLLGLTKNFIKSHFELPFRVIAS